MADISFVPRTSMAEIEEGTGFAPKFDAAGLIPCVTTDAETGELLMFAYMNAEALRQTIALGEAVYWSRSRGEIWHKGATSGHVQKVVEMRVDCDQDCIWLRVDTGGKASCHVGYRSCFYRSVPVGGESATLTFAETEKLFDPKVVYGS
jgi:phosphoribosyl-AMP cyclohydrolase